MIYKTHEKDNLLYVLKFLLFLLFFVTDAPRFLYFLFIISILFQELSLAIV